MVVNTIAYLIFMIVFAILTGVFASLATLATSAWFTILYCLLGGVSGYFAYDCIQRLTKLVKKYG